MIPHITNEIKERILASPTDDVDVVITEVGGTVGDIEILPFLEAIRQFRKDVGRENVFYVHVTLVPFIGPSGEQKTKPTQHSVTELRSRGIQPDAIVCRERPADPRRGSRRRSPSSATCPKRASSPRSTPRSSTRSRSCSTTRASTTTCAGCCTSTSASPTSPSGRRSWQRVAAADVDVRIGLVGKYVNLPDAYLSVVEALKHGGYGCGAEVVDRLDRRRRHRGPARRRPARTTSTASWCPAGSAFRGIEGKIAAAGYAREHERPVPRAVPRAALRGDRVRARRVRPRRRELERVRPAHARTR